MTSYERNTCRDLSGKKKSSFVYLGLLSMRKMTAIPFNRTHVVGDIVFAARGGNIHSFSLLDGRHVSTWQHPDVTRRSDTAADGASATQAASSQPLDLGGASTETIDARQSPAKRQRLESGQDRLEAPAGDDVHAPGPALAGKTEGDAFEAQVNRIGDFMGEKKGKASQKKSRSEHQARQVARVPDRPLITQVTSSADGRHVLAVSGHDKVIWVFEHDGLGRLTQQSQRTMPKRPSAVVVADDTRIVCADKFGDVYALPLVPLPRSSSTTSTPRPASVQPPARPAGMEASTLTVYSKRNREALDNQRRQLELQKQQRCQEPPARAHAPDFEFTLLLGHVSMLTALVLAESEGRTYIVTADRDEHIRVSRYMPHAHIIEGFCLGHRSFVSDIVIPPLRRDVLVSGGGDDELFVWDWKAGAVHSRASILTLVKTVAPEATSVAISGLFSLLYPSGADKLTYILAICEDIDAVFSWQLNDANALKHPAIIELPGSPLHLSCSACDPGNALPRLIVAMHQGQTPSQSLRVFNLTMNAGRLALDTESALQELQLQADEMDVSENEIRRLLFNVENLRKHSRGGDDNDPAGTEAADGDAIRTWTRDE